MTTDHDNPAPNDDWMSNPAPVPRAIGEPAHQSTPAAAAKPPKKKGNVTPLRPLEALGAELENAPQVAGPELGPDPEAGPQGTPPPDQGQPVRPKGKNRPHGEIWDGCPVIPLGINGPLSYYLDGLGQLRREKNHDQETIKHLFGVHIPALCYRFPKFNAQGIRKPNQFEATQASQIMVIACAERGLFDAQGAVRGVGAWTDDDGQLIYHTGAKLMTAGGELDTGRHQGRIYPSYPPVPMPATTAGAGDVVGAIGDELATWNWRRPDIDPEITLGFVGCMMMGGALDWRPHGWITGSKSTGKSRFQSLLSHLNGGEKGLLRSENATAAAIANILRMSTLPVALDELEPDAHNSAKAQQIIELMRIASSGGRRIRSSPDQTASETIIRSTFLASSIIIPGVLRAQDRSRILILDLMEFPPGSPTPPPLRAETWRRRGAHLKRLLIDRWPSWAARLELWREALALQRIDGRNGDNWATIMAMADMARHPDLPSAEVTAGWAAKLAHWVKADMAEIGGDADDVITWLLSKQIDPMRRGVQHTIGAWLKAAGQRPGAGQRIFGSDSLEDERDHAKKANRHLTPYGLRVVGSATDPRLFVAYKPIQGLLELFAGSDWAGGAWAQSLGRIKDAAPHPNSLYFDGIQTRGVNVPFASIPGLMMLDGKEPAAEPSRPPDVSPMMEDF